MKKYYNHGTRIFVNADTNVSLRSEFCMPHDALILCFIGIVIVHCYQLAQG